MRKFALTLLTFCVLCISQAQKPEDKLADWGERSPIEKVYLHFDREQYLAGETAWFKAYLSSDYQPDTISSVLYVELLRDSLVLVDRKVLPILFGATNGHFDIPDSLTAGTYLVRAYTPSQVEKDPFFIYQRHLHVFGRKPVRPAGSPLMETRLEFFPESGNLVRGVQNTVAVKATNERGLPVNFEGIVFDANNKQVATFSSIHDGMGMFDLVPSGNGYYVVSTAEPGGKRYALPEPMEEGVVLSTFPHPQGHFYEIRSNGGGAMKKAAYMIGQMQHHIVFRKELRSEKDLSGLINTTNLRSGIMQVTLFNADGLPLAERLCFVNNREYIQKGEIIADTINKTARSRNRFHLQLKDTIEGSFSISVTDPDLSTFEGREENIYSRFLLSSDLRGYIHQPARYFDKDDEATQTALDLLMMTHGWRRFNWTNIPVQVPETRDPGFIKLSGKVALRDTKKPFDNKSLLIYIVGSDSARNIISTRTDGNGRFVVDSLFFFGSARLMFSDARGKKGLYIDAKLDPDTLQRQFLLPGETGTPINRYEIVAKTAQSRLSEDYDLIYSRGTGLLMEGITVKTRKKSPLQELEERYASGMFSGMSEKILDLTDNKETMAYANILDYLQLRVPGLEIGSDGADYVVYYRQGPSISSMGEIPMTLFLNEIQTDANTLATIHASEIAMIKIYSNFVGATGNGAGGAMAIYTKKGEDRLNISSGRSSNLRYNGFSVIKEFYSPDYQSPNTDKNKADNRITLQWKPDIMINGIDPKFSFSFDNNDRTKKFRVVVEGMTLDGKLLCLEKDF